MTRQKTPNVRIAMLLAKDRKWTQNYIEHKIINSQVGDLKILDVPGQEIRNVQG